MIEALATALHLFRTQKARFLLTVSGIVVGVASLVVLASLLTVGQEVLARASSEATGDDIITVSNDWRKVMDNPDAKKLTAVDQQNIDRSELISEGTEVTGAYGLRDRTATFGEESFSAMTMGVDDTAFSVYGLKMGRGRTFLSAEYGEMAHVVIAGSKVLDGRIKPGDTIRLEGTPYHVVGVMAEKAEMGPGGRWSWNHRLLFPASTYRMELDPSRRPSEIVVKVALPVGYAGLLKDYVLSTRNVLDAILSRGRSAKTWEFEGVSDGQSTEELILLVIQALVYLTTLFSMIVGGINIMNIMLVTVAERTREIGVRRAIGASQQDILRQFVSETLAVTVMGALLGLGVALALLGVGTAALNAWVTEWPFRVELWAVGLSMGFSMVIGLGFGIYPAWRASRLDPVEALRTE